MVDFVFLQITVLVSEKIKRGPSTETTTIRSIQFDDVVKPQVFPKLDSLNSIKSDTDSNWMNLIILCICNQAWTPWSTHHMEGLKKMLKATLY